MCNVYFCHTNLSLMNVQPQNCVPDVVIWMLSDNKRVAVKRIPSHKLMYSAVSKCRGRYCGKLQTIYLTVSKLEWQLSACVHV